MKAADDVVEAIPVASGTLVGNGYPTTSTGMATATAQPIVVPGAQFVQPQIVYQQQPQLLVTGPRQTYCGPITLLFALCLVFLIGPFAILLVFCPCDEMERQQVVIVQRGAADDKELEV